MSTTNRLSGSLSGLHFRNKSVPGKRKRTFGRRRIGSTWYNISRLAITNSARGECRARRPAKDGTCSRKRWRHLESGKESIKGLSILILAYGCELRTKWTDFRFYQLGHYTLNLFHALNLLSILDKEVGSPLCRSQVVQLLFITCSLYQVHPPK